MRTISILIVSFFLSAIAYAQGEPPNDGASFHCSVLIIELSVVPSMRDNGGPLARTKETLDGQITEDFPVVMTQFMTQADIVEWRNAVATSPQDMADWNAAIESIYNSKITEKQIYRLSKKYCTPHTKHVLRASDLNSLLSKSKSQQEKSDASIAPGKQGDADGQDNLRSLEPEINKAANKLEDVGRCKQDKNCYCTYLGIFYTTLAGSRDQGESPQQWYKALGSYWEKLFPEKLVKKIINQVYFDPGFVNAGGEKLNYQMRDICLGNTFKPLK